MSYSDEQKAVALAALEANRGDVERTAKFMKIPPSTIRHWKNGHCISPEIAKSGEIKKELLSDKLERLAMALADAAFEKTDEAGLQQVATSMAIAIDKMQLLREKPTSIIQANDSPETRMARIDSLFDAARSRRGGTAPDVGTESPTVN